MVPLWVKYGHTYGPIWYFHIWGPYLFAPTFPYGVPSGKALQIHMVIPIINPCVAHLNIPIYYPYGVPHNKPICIPELFAHSFPKWANPYGSPLVAIWDCPCPYSQIYPYGKVVGMLPGLRAAWVPIPSYIGHTLLNCGTGYTVVQRWWCCIVFEARWCNKHVKSTTGSQVILSGFAETPSGRLKYI